MFRQYNNVQVSITIETINININTASAILRQPSTLVLDMDDGEVLDANV